MANFGTNERGASELPHSASSHFDYLKQSCNTFLIKMDTKFCKTLNVIRPVISQILDFDYLKLIKQFCKTLNVIRPVIPQILDFDYLKLIARIPAKHY